MALSDEEFDSLGFTFVWRIENFSHCLDGKNCHLKSPDFYVNLFGTKTVWYLSIIPRYSSGEVNIIKFLLKKVSPWINTRSPVNVDFQLAILASDGSLASLTEQTREYSYNNLYGNLIDKEELFGKKKDFYLPLNTLTLQLRMWDSDKVRSWLGQGFARTRIGVRKMSILHEFHIEHGCHFEIEPELKEKISLKFYFNKSLDYDEKLQMEICETDPSQENLICCKIDLIDFSGSLVHLCTEDHLFQRGEGEKTLAFTIPLLKSTLSLNPNLYSQRNFLKLKCDLALSIGVVYSELEVTDVGPGYIPYVNSFIPEVHQLQHKSENFAKLPDSLSSDLFNLYTEGADCDFELRAGSSSFPVRKAALMARSPVFRSMLSSDMIEKNTNRVDIPDLDSDIVKRMLHFLYTEAIEVVEWGAISKLYFAADKYGIEPLKKKCSSFLERNICASNVCEALELGDLHQGQDLKDAATAFVLRNDDKILSSDEWMLFKKRNCSLAADVLQWMYLKKSENK